MSLPLTPIFKRTQLLLARRPLPHPIETASRIALLLVITVLLLLPRTLIEISVLKFIPKSN